MLYWRLAFRNLLRHRGRLILNLILLVGAFSTIVCFKGFKSHVLNTIHDLIIDSQFGHLQVEIPCVSQVSNDDNWLIAAFVGYG